MARKQKDLPGMERQVNAEVEAAAEAYVASRTKRIKLLGAEVADKLALIAARYGIGRGHVSQIATRRLWRESP